ncbi:CHAT domain-containing protein [Aquabacterium sp.]|uniref:CHAT domain-containing protein n=1 Tax=Aquabacterium sp. TaxID=1872578 RepID=UPI004037869E
MPRRTLFESARRPAGLLSTLSLAVLMLASGAAHAQSNAQPNAGGDAEGRQTAQALLRVREATQPRTLVNEGQALLDRDVIKLDGYAYCGQATSLAEQGDFRQSIRAASKALFLGERDKKPDLQALAHRDLAMAYLYAGKIDEAEQYARSALLFPGASPEQVLAPAHKILGDVAARRGNQAAAITEYNDALKTASERYRPQVLVSLANALNASGQPKQALQQLDAIGPEARAALASFYLRSRAAALLADEQPEAALAVYDQIATGDQTADSEYQRLWALVGVGRVHLKRNDKPQALAAFLKATTLANGLRAKFRSEEFRTGLFGDMQAVYDQTLALAVEQKDFVTAWNLSEDSRSRQLLDSVRGRADDALGGRLSLPQLQALLRPDEGVLEFHAVGDQLVVWTIRANSFEGRALALPQAALAREVDEFRRSIIERKRDVDAQGQALYNKLMGSVKLGEGANPITRLFIVPHGPLHYLPFQALHDGQGYLIARTAVAVWPSASVGGQLWARPSKTVSALLAFGNPATQENVPLPGAEREVNEVSALFKQKQIFVQRDATKMTFKLRANQSAVLHVAAHAEVDDVDPLFSRILLANDGQDRGLLEAREVYGLDMRSVSLVTLSACESGLGKVQKGDEIVGFTRSFLSAGASSMVASLWPVADDSTEALMTRMYQSMSEGADLMDAMRTAQTEVQKRRRFAHPFFWAPFNVIGNGRMQLGS